MHENEVESLQVIEVDSQKLLFAVGNFLQFG